MNKILVIGNMGQLGWELERSLLAMGEIFPIDYPQIDLRDPSSIHFNIEKINPSVIINAAAYTAVDKAEKEQEDAKLVNAVAPGLLAEEALNRHAIFIHFSTDYVFNGKSAVPYLETDQPDPINIYGKTKLAGEQAIAKVGGEFFIFRTSWLYSTRRDCFLIKVLKWARTNEELLIVADQIGSPTWCRSLSDAISLVLQIILSADNNWRMKHSGIYHLAGKGAVNRYDWAESILKFDPFQQEHIYRKLHKVDSSEFNTTAKRPNYSALDCSKFEDTFNLHFPDWLMSLKLALES